MQQKFPLSTFVVLFVLIFSIVFSIPVFAFPQDNRTTPQRIAIPITLLKGNVPAISASIGAEAKGLFLIQSASAMGFVTESFVKKYHLTISKSEFGEVVKSDQIGIGSLKRSGGLYVIRDSMAQTLDTNGVSGVLGVDVFDDMALRVDLAHQKCILFTPGNLSPGVLKAEGFEEVVNHPLRMRHDNRWRFLVSVDVNGTTVDAVLSLNVSYASLPQSNTPSQESTGTIAHLGIGGANLSNLPVYFNDAMTSEGVFTIGMVALSQCELLFDYAARKVYIHSAGPNHPIPVTTKPAVDSSQAFEVPISNIYGGIPAIPLTIGTEAKGSFLLMTNTPGNFVTEQFVKKFHLQVTQYMGRDFVTPRSIQFGTQSVETSDGVSFYVLRGQEATLCDKGGISGGLGTNMLTPVAVHVDFDKQRCRFILAGNLSPDTVKAEGFADAVAHPIRTHVDNVGRAVAEIEYNGIPVEALLDLRGTSVVLPKNYAPFSGKPKKQGGLRIGGFDMPPVPIQFVDDPTTPGIGSVGINVLSRCNLLFDLSAKKVYLRPANPNNPTSRANRSDGFEAFKQGKVVLPFQPMPLHGGPIVSLQVNGRYTGRFLLDTGFPLCIIGKPFATKAGLLTDTMPGQSDRSGNRFVRMPTRFGESVVDFPVSVSENPIMNAVASQGVDGILGMEFLKRFAVVFDFSHQRCTLLLHGNLSKDAIVALGFGNVASKAIVRLPGEDLSFSVPVTINGQALPLILDTGMTVSLLPQMANLSHHRLIAFPGILGWYGKIDAQGIPIERFTVGPVIFSDVLGLVKTEQSSQNPSHLGMDILSRCDLLVDFPGNKLYIRPATNPQNASHVANQQVGVRDIVIGRSGPKEWSVLSFDGKGPFTQAGVQVGDILSQINGRPLPQGFPVEAGHALVANRTYPLTVLRGPSRKRVVLTVSIPTKSE